MPWQPTTRGTKKSKQVCHYGVCKDSNIELTYYIVDTHGIRYFCNNHWRWACLLFGIVKDCNRCERNHLAELNKNSRDMDSFKYNNKWWNLCFRHRNVFNMEMCLFTALDLDLYPYD